MHENYNNPIGAKVLAIIYDCDKPKELATFYAKLLGGKVDSDPFGGYSVSAPGLGIDLTFQEDKFYVKPIWLGNEHDQQPMIHIDIKSG